MFCFYFKQLGVEDSKLTGADLKFLAVSDLYSRYLTHMQNTVYKDDSIVYKE